MIAMAVSESSKVDESASPPIEVLIIDNDRSHAEAVAESLDRVGFSCQVAASGTQGAQMIEEGTYEVIITDLVMTDVDGFGILTRAKKELPDAEVILMTGHGSIPSAVEAMQQGAFNYLLKPLDLSQLRTVAEKAAERSRLRRANVELKRRLDEKFGFEGVVGGSPQMRDVIERLKRIAPTTPAC
jgi:two-component system response regulator HydG